MASPAVAAVVEGGLTSAGTNLAVTLPGGGSASDEYIVIIAKGSVSVTINALAGWTELLDEASALGLAIIRYTGAGVPSNPTFVQSGSSRSVWCAYRITGADKATAPEVGTTATGTSTTPNPPSRAVTGGPKDILAIACFTGAGELADDNSLVTTFPTNYTDGQVEKTGGTTGTNLGGILGAAARQVSAVSSEDPGTFTQNASRAWRANTIVVHPLPPKSTSVARISLAAGSEPDTRTAHSIKIRARVTGGTGTIRAALYEGATNRSGDLESSALTGSLADYTLSIPDASAANITDYSDLEIRFWGYSAAGDAATFEIDQIWVEIPAASGPTTYFGVTAMPITFGKAVVGTKKTFAQTATPITFGKAVVGQRKTFGQVLLPITFTKDVSAQRKTFGQIALPLTFGKAVAGTKKTFGQTALPITVGISTAGFRVPFTYFGVVAMPLTFGKDVAGIRRSFGQIALPITFGKDVSGQRKTFGQVALPITFTKEFIGRRSTFGQFAMPLTFGKQVAGTKKTFGQVALPIVFGKEVSGRKHTYGQVLFPIEFEAFVDGFNFVGPKTLYGVVDFPMVFGKEVVAYRKTFGQITAPYNFGASVQGIRETFGEFELPMDLLFDVDSGSVGVHGEVSFPIVFGVDTNGIIKPIAIILNLADMVYLGDTPVIAVYTEGQQVWP